MPRLFTGLELPPEMAGAIALLRGGLPGARWMEPADYHITLRFIGDVEAGVARDLAESLSEIRRPSFEVRFEGLDAFGGGKPRAVVARVKPDSDLVELQAEQERRMRRVGLPPETRKFTPHVTLARLHGVSARAVAGYLAVRGGAAIARFTAGRFVLFSARDSVGGGPYVVEATYPLEPSRVA